jgi:hypothetical protein
MHTFRLLAVGTVMVTTFLIAPRCIADVAMMPPQNIVITKWPDDRDLIFVLFLEGEFEKGIVLDPKNLDEANVIRVPQKGLPVGDLSILGVPRVLVDKAEKLPDPAWVREGVPGIIRVAGVIHTNPIEKHSAVHQYELRATAAGLEAILLNPDVLLPYRRENPEPDRPPTSAYLWGALAGGLILLAAALVWSCMRSSSSHS